MLVGGSRRPLIFNPRRRENLWWPVRKGRGADESLNGGEGEESNLSRGVYRVGACAGVHVPQRAPLD